MLKYWPIHFPPFKDESLYSWLSRISFAHEQSVRALVVIACGKVGHAWDLDRALSYSELFKIASLSGQHPSALYKASLNGILSRIQPVKSPTDIRWLITKAQNDYTRTMVKTPICPLCLQEDPKPYLRREWRLPFYTYCRRHNVLMVDCCHNCSTPLNIHRDYFWESRELSSKVECSNCGHYISELEPAKAYNDMIYSVYQAAMADHANIDFIAIRSFFSSVSRLLEVVGGLHINVELDFSFSPLMKVEGFKSVVERGYERRRFSKQPVKVRHNVLNLCEYILSKTPWEIINGFAKNQCIFVQPAGYKVHNFVEAAFMWANGDYRKVFGEDAHIGEIFNLSYIEKV